jgi:hypothetical protein
MSKTTRQALADGVALVPGHELLLDRRNRRLQLLNLCRHGGQPQDFEASNMPSLRFRESKDPSVAEVWADERAGGSCFIPELTHRLTGHTIR